MLLHLCIKFGKFTLKFNELGYILHEQPHFYVLILSIAVGVNVTQSVAVLTYRSKWTKIGT